MDLIEYVILLIAAYLSWITLGWKANALQLNVQNAVILDVRTPREFSSGHVEGAINIPVQSLQKDSIETIVQKEQPILVYCRSGVRSKKVVFTLQSWGYTHVYNLRTKSKVEHLLRNNEP